MRTGIRKFTATAILCAVVSAVLTLGIRPALADSKTATGDLHAAFGSVDLQRVFNEYKVKQASSDEISKIGQGYDKILQRLIEGSAIYLPEGDVQELAKLYEKTSTTDSEKQRIGALETKAKAMGEELRNLQNLATPSDQQRTRLSELTAAKQKGNDVLESLRQDYQQRLSTRQGELSQKITEDMRAAIAKIAQGKNLAVVFDAAVAVYTSNDITNDVIKQLNK